MVVVIFVLCACEIDVRVPAGRIQGTGLWVSVGQGQKRKLQNERSINV